jgi:hypothetical protein
MSAAVSAQLVERGDLDDLTRHVDRLCRAELWDELVDLRFRCHAALAPGRQLWPIASYIEFRLALDAPGPWAAAALVSGAGRFALGPLPEVAASTHLWAELAPHLVASPAAAMAAHERVVRGEDLSSDTAAASLPSVLDVPLALQPWEPVYSLAEYEPDQLHAPPPAISTSHATLAPRLALVGRPTDDPDSTSALTDLVSAWVSESNGRAVAVAVRGTAGAAVTALGASAPRMAEIAGPDALALMAWAAASGGAHGRRRGAASGRFGAWWTAAALGGLSSEWPPSADDVGEVVMALRWFVWDAGEPEVGWVLRLAAEDTDESLAWAVAAVDTVQGRFS